MKNKIFAIVETGLLFIITAALLFAEQTAFAWLSTTWRSGTFTVRSALSYAPDISVWTCTETFSKTNPTRTWVNLAKAETDDNSGVYVDSVGTYSTSGGVTTFTKNVNAQLYLGTIYSLAQEQENLPVYVKVKLKLPANSTNVLKFDCSLPTESYLEIYKIENNVGKKQSGTWVDTMNQNRSEYKFLNIQYYLGETCTETPNPTADGGAKYIEFKNTDSSVTYYTSAPEYVLSGKNEQEQDSGKIYLSGEFEDVGNTFEAYLKSQPTVLLRRSTTHRVQLKSRQ